MPSKDKSAIGRSNVRTGKNHERRVAKLFSEWSGVEFRRRKVEGRDNATLWIDSTADVIPTTADFLFSIEAKKGKGFSMDALFSNPVGCLFGSWWFQACYDANLISNLKNRTVLPLVFFKPHPQHDWVAVSTRAMDHLKPKAGIMGRDGSLWFPHAIVDEYRWLGNVTGTISYSRKHRVTASHTMDSLFLCRWNDFAANVDPQPLLTART